MKWPRPKFTVRRAMLAILVIAVLLGAILPALEVVRAPGYHVHAWVDPNAKLMALPAGLPIGPRMPATIKQIELRPSPFWPRYWRCLTGRPWRGQPLCDPDPTRVAEACEYAHPEIVKRQDPVVFKPFDIEWTPEILAEAQRRAPRSAAPGLTSGPGR
jgi:hypothetical protein